MGFLGSSAAGRVGAAQLTFRPTCNLAVFFFWHVATFTSYEELCFLIGVLTWLLAWQQERVIRESVIALSQGFQAR